MIHPAVGIGVIFIKGNARIFVFLINMIHCLVIAVFIYFIFILKIMTFLLRFGRASLFKLYEFKVLARASYGRF